MRIEHREEENPFKSLSTIQKLSYIAAVAAAFVSVFTWFFKILFF
jgi:hypothetical protein